MTPFVERLLRRLAKTEINGAREELFGPVDSARGQKFLCADHAEGIALLGPDEVLPAFATRER